MLDRAEAEAVMGRIYARGDRLMLWFVAAHLPVALFLATFNQTWKLTLAVAPAAVLGFWACVRFLPRTFFTRCMAGVLLEVFCALHIYQMHGQPEQHFWFFAAFTMMIVYQDWISMWPGALLIIGQHILFALLTNAGHDMMFFPDHHVGFWKMFFHFGIACVQVGIAGYWAHLLRGQTLRFAAQERQLKADVASQAAAADALRASEERTRLVIETALDAIVIIDQDERVTDWNPQATTLFGVSREDAMGRRLTDVVYAPELRDRQREALQRLMVTVASDSTRTRFVTEGQRADGTLFPMELTAAAVPGSHGMRFSGFCRDLSEQRRLERERRELESRMQEAQQRESLGVLAGGIAHDFNNLLVGILGNAGLARLELPPEAAVVGTLEHIEQAAKRASDLANQMLAYAGKGRLVVQAVRLPGIVQEMTHLIGTAISKKAVLELRLEEHVPPVEADATQLRQVVMNLITNASDALEDRPGVIVVTTRVAHVDAPALASYQLAEALVPGRYVMLEVSDSGRGMDAATLARIFDPFFTTKFTGRGLGLASVLGIVRSHRGALRVTSEPGRGTTFTVLLPPCESPECREAEARTVPVKQATATGTILVVDDEAVVRHVAHRCLTRHGYDVVPAADGPEAIGVVRRDGARIDAVLLDLTMPHLSGEETLAELRRLAPELPVILTSGYTEDAVRTEATRVSFLAKPYSPHQLYEAVRAATRS